MDLAMARGSCQIKVIWCVKIKSIEYQFCGRCWDYKILWIRHSPCPKQNSQRERKHHSLVTSVECSGKSCAQIAVWHRRIPDTIQWSGQESRLLEKIDTKLSAFTIVCSKPHFEENVAFTFLCVLAFLKQSFLSLLSVVVTSQDTITENGIFYNFW